MKKPSPTTNILAVSITFAVLIAACAAPQAGAPPAAPAAPTAAQPAQEAAAPTAMPAGEGAMDMAALIAAAQAEGELNVIALPHDWCNYGEMIEGFKKKYGLKVNEITPDAGSAEELEAVKANKDNKGPQAPDVLDVGPAFAVQAVEEDLVMPYKVSTWDSIPDNLKHPDGMWTGNYYGVMSMQVNVDAVPAVPQDFADLLKPEYKGMVSINDPRIGNSQAQAVLNAALAMGGSADDTTKGLEFFAQLNAIGNFLPSWNQQTFGRGETPIVFDWDYNALTQRDANKDSINIEVVIPKSAQLAGHYATAISKYAPHPNAAKLWMEYTFSDEGSLIWIKGYCHPTRYNDLVARKVIPEDLAAQLPSDELYAKATFPTLEQLNKHKQLLADNWDKVTKIEFRKLQ
ncbi:MAG: extracellular solute-binding protein [Anaerolineae bacterium]|nr:extracellular solute-binding protein [Anaerolineae bacterium]